MNWVKGYAVFVAQQEAGGRNGHFHSTRSFFITRELTAPAALAF